MKIALEIWDILDSFGNATGKTIVREKFCLQKGEYHRVVHIWLVNSKGQFLIQRRSDEKDFMPGEWAATGGAVVSNENSYAAAARELSEELGIFTDHVQLKLARSYIRKNSFVDIWFANMDFDINNLVLQADEVAEAKWVSKSELQEMLQKGLFHNYGADYFETIFALTDNCEPI